MSEEADTSAQPGEVPEPTGRPTPDAGLGELDRPLAPPPSLTAELRATLSRQVPVEARPASPVPEPAVARSKPRRAEPGVSAPEDQVEPKEPGDSESASAAPATPDKAREDPVRAVPGTKGVRRESAAGSGWPLAGGALALTLATGALLVWRFRRGDVAVGLRYPDELTGTFRVSLLRRRGQIAPASRGEILEGRRSSRTRHDHVSRETRFSRVQSGRYVVHVEGFLRDPLGGELLDEIRRERVVVVRPGRMVRADLEISPELCAVAVEVRWNETRCDAVAAVLGQAGTSTHTRGGRVRLRLPLGEHQVAIGSGDRVALCNIEIDRFQPQTLLIDLGASDSLVFKGCPPAVDAYVRADFEGAAAALERDAQSHEAKRVLADGLRLAGRLDEAACALEAGQHFAAAASVREEMGESEVAATLWESAGDFNRAAALFEGAQAWQPAGRAHERARNFDSAIACYERAADIPSWVSVLERLGQPFEAAELALKHGDEKRATRLLQRVPPDDTDFSRSCELLAKLFELDQQWEQAAQKLAEYLATLPKSEEPRDELRARVAELFERAGNLGRAIEMLEELSLSHPTYPNISTRIEVLRKRFSASQTEQTRVVRGTPQLAATVVLAEPMAVVLDRYELLEKIGQGGMGEVYRARDQRLDRVVALKRISEDLRSHRHAVEIFLGEAQAAARLNHPHIVTVYDADQQDGIVYITMELLEGRPLHHVLHDAGRLAPEQVARLGSQVASGLDYAHQQGVIHRDVKTSNLFLVADDFVKLMDFGLAKITERVRRGSTLIGGTPYYMAPEQAVSGPIDPRTDLYGLGVTLFELATGSLPFSEGDIAAQHRSTPPPDPREMAPALPDGLAELILSLLAKRPEERPPTAGHVFIDLERWARARA